MARATPCRCESRRPQVTHMLGAHGTASARTAPLPHGTAPGRMTLRRLGTILGLAAAVVALANGCSRRQTVSILPLGKACQIEISYWYEPGDPGLEWLHYQVQDLDGGALTKWVGFGIPLGPRDMLKFQMLEGSGGDVFGVIEDSSPNKVLIVGQFSADYLWPGKPDSLGRDPRREVGEALVAELNREHPGGPLVLRNGAPVIVTFERADGPSSFRSNIKRVK